MRPWIMAFALFVSLAPPALACSIRANIEGPAADGVTYTARTISYAQDGPLEPWAHAEGVVDGKRRSVLIRLKPTGEYGVYTFERTWPAEGSWMIRLSLGHPPSPATVATLRADGTVQRNRHYFKSDGSRECSRALNPKRGANDDDC